MPQLAAKDPMTYSAQLSTSSLSFDAVPVGQTASKSVLLMNTGTGVLTLTPAVVTGSAFGLSSQCGASLAAGASCLSTVTFSPSDMGAASGNASFGLNTPDAPLVVSLSGQGLRTTGALTADVSSSFGDVAVGSSLSRAFTFTNSGNQAASGVYATVSGSGLTLESNTCGTFAAKTSVSGSGGVCFVAVKYTPTTQGTLTGSLSVASSADNSPSTLVLSGAALQATGALTADTSAAFGSVSVGSTLSRTFTFKNSGNLEATGVYAALSGAGASQVNLSANTCGTAASPTTVAAGNSTCAVTVQYAPTAVGAMAATLSVLSSAPNSPSTLALTGTGTQAVGALTANTSADFGTVTTVTSASRTFTFTNSGNVPATGTYATVVGTSVSITSNTCGTAGTPVSVAGGGTCSITLQYAPTSAGTLAGSLTVQSSAANSPSTLSLTGAGTGPTFIAYSGAVTTYNVATTGTYIIDVYGGQGGGATGRGKSGGLGARVTCSVALTAGTTLKLLVGGQGASAANYGGGGGGSYVATSANTPVCVAGGGGGASFVANGNSGQGLSGTGAGGTGYTSSFWGTAGGGGFNGNGTNSSNLWGATSFVNGGAPGAAAANISGGFAIGGFGGGSAGGGGNWTGGAGGGYNGGNGSSDSSAGIGGTSFGSGTVTNVTNAANTGNGKIGITAP